MQQITASAQSPLIKINITLLTWLPERTLRRGETRGEKKGGKHEGKICSDEAFLFYFLMLRHKAHFCIPWFWALRRYLHVRSYSFQEGAQTYFPWQQTICSSLTPPFLHHTWWHGPDIAAVSTHHMCCYTRQSSHAVTTKILKIWERDLFWKMAINDQKKSIFGKNKLWYTVR